MAAAATTSEQRRSLLTPIDMGARESVGNPQRCLGASQHFPGREDSRISASPKGLLRVDSVEKLRARKLDVQERAFLCDLSRKTAFQATLVRAKLDQNRVPRDRRSFSTQ